MKRILLIFLSFFIFANFMFAAVNINTANEKELMTLSGIGEAKAKAIIAYRSKNRFKKIEDIMQVGGIGQGIFDKIKNDITVGGTQPNKAQVKK
ncbi:DNA-binding protein [Helicobacter muridarum]|uniref:ComE operon protein 1 n=1 Tax=Helicobacter muridarum TaxID=216 RepID=A0A099TZK2_9HELI|nr:helix-hairpin-helix domain-containing protein [Helicobacter muridarum]TLD97974.1 DNA-binding protein [Helicobacter muridarum]STQ86157.1 ComE operon protein 1 [Helicobacter muridarum]